QIPGLPIPGIQSATSGTHPRADPGLYCLAHCSCLATPVQAKPIQPFQLVLLDLQHSSDSYCLHVARTRPHDCCGQSDVPSHRGYLWFRTHLPDPRHGPVVLELAYGTETTLPHRIRCPTG